MRKYERKEQRSLILSEQTFPIIEQITAGMPGGFFIYHADEEERLIYANQALIQIYGCKSLEEFQEYTGYTFQGLLHPEDIEATQQSIKQQIFTHGSDLDHVEYRIVRKDGTVRWIEDFGHFVRTDLYGDVFWRTPRKNTSKRSMTLKRSSWPRNVWRRWRRWSMKPRR